MPSIHSLNLDYVCRSLHHHLVKVMRFICCRGHKRELFTDLVSKRAHPSAGVHNPTPTNDTAALAASANPGKGTQLCLRVFGCWCRGFLWLSSAWGGWGQLWEGLVPWEMQARTQDETQAAEPWCLLEKLSEGNPDKHPSSSE